MSEDTTRGLPDARSFEERVIEEFAALRQEFKSINGRLSSLESRLSSLEDKVDARLKETRPIWEGVQARLSEIESTLEDINYQLKLLVADLFKTRVRVEKLEERPPAA